MTHPRSTMFTENYPAEAKVLELRRLRGFEGYTCLYYPLYTGDYHDCRNMSKWVKWVASRLLLVIFEEI